MAARKHDERTVETRAAPTSSSPVRSKGRHRAPWLSLAVLLLLQACASAYSPPVAVAPLLDEAGDVTIGASIHAASPRRGSSAFLAAAPSRSTRAFAAGYVSRERGELGEADERILRRHNRTTYGELGGGWGMSAKRLVLEALLGIGYGQSDVAACAPRLIPNKDGDCQAWVDGRARITRGLAQVHAAARTHFWRGGGGLRLSMARYAYDELFGKPTDQSVLLPTLEPFIVQRLVLRYVSFEAQLQVVLVLHQPTVHNQARTRSEEPFHGPTPRLWIGMQLHPDELFRRR